VHLDDPNSRTRPYEKWAAYGQSKTANSLFAVELTRRYMNQGVTANAVHPGGIMTNLQRFLPREEQIAMGWMDEQGQLNPGFKSPEQGAATSVWAAVGRELEGIGGLYLEDVREALPFDPANPFSGYMPYARDARTAQALWTLSETLVG
jgi:NAD(P)-dependent dehydrogenase (short-subunit alcohol dehydrogenase family)